MQRIGRATIAAMMALTLSAQDAPIIRGGIELVDVLASVRDKKGGISADLKQSEFHIFEDGVEQEIRGFSRQTDLPLTIGVLMDVSGSVAEEIPAERRAAAQFFKQVLRSEDQAFLIGFAGQAVLLQDTTHSLSELEDGLADLESVINRPPPQQPQLKRFFTPFQVRGGGRGGGGMPVGGGGMGGPGGPMPGQGKGGGGGNFTGTVLYDAVYLAANEVLDPLTGRKVIILISDGQDYGSQVTLANTLEAAVKSDAIIFSIYVDTEMKQRQDGKEIMERMADKTGGRLFELGRRNQLEKIFKEIETELRTQYSISYSPKKGLVGRGFRNIELRVDRKDFKVRTREGYYPQAPTR